MEKRVLVCGAGGFVGGYLVKALLDRGEHVWAVSSRPLKDWLQVHPGALNEGGLDLRKAEVCDYAVSGVDEVYNLAAKVGGIGYIEKHRVDCALSSLINTHLLLAAAKFGVQRFFFSSSACVYPTAEGLIKESDAYPANPSAGYGWEKLFSEQMCEYFQAEAKIPFVSIGRFFTTYGPGDNWKGIEGKHHVPSALCEKVALAKMFGRKSIGVWGDGTQRRNFLYVGDAVEGSIRLMNSGAFRPVNLGGTECVSVNELLDIIEGIAGTKLERVYQTDESTGVRARASDNSRCREVLDWEPGTSLRDGLALTYAAIEARLRAV